MRVNFRRYMRDLGAVPGRVIIIQSWGVAFRGEVVKTYREAVELTSVMVLDETGRERTWMQADGHFHIPRCNVRYVQVIG